MKYNKTTSKYFPNLIPKEIQKPLEDMAKSLLTGNSFLTGLVKVEDSFRKKGNRKGINILENSYNSKDESIILNAYGNQKGYRLLVRFDLRRLNELEKNISSLNKKYF